MKKAVAGTGYVGLSIATLLAQHNQVTSVDIVTARVLTGMRDVFKECKPDVVLVHGDTTTSTAAALAAFYQQIPVGYVEAGLRTHNIYSPWPEEMNL